MPFPFYDEMWRCLKIYSILKDVYFIFFYNTVTQVLLSYDFGFRSVQYFLGTTDIFLRILFYNFFSLAQKKTI